MNLEKQTKQKKILIIDDDKFLLDMYTLKFKEKGFDVNSILWAQEALSVLEGKQFEPDVVLVDLVMPGIDGFEFLQIVRDKKLLEHGKAIVLSNLGEAQDIEKAKSLGAVGYIIKANNTPSEVVNQVVDILGK